MAVRWRAIGLVLLGSMVLFKTGKFLVKVLTLLGIASGIAATAYVNWYKGKGGGGGNGDYDY